MTGDVAGEHVPLIRVEHVGFRYRQAKEQALTDVSLEVLPGQILLIAGPSGCGKSTLLRCLNGLIPNSYRGELTGDVRIAGRSTRELRLAEISRVVGTVLQDPERQIVASHVLEEVAFGLENLGLEASRIVDRAESSLGELDLFHLKERETCSLSGGEKQKLAVAGVLALEPQVLIMDEPLAHLDPVSARETLALCRRLAAKGCAVVIVEHRVEEVLRIGPERVLLLEEGRVTYDGTGEGLAEAADPRAVKLPAPLALRLLAGSPRAVIEEPGETSLASAPPAEGKTPLIELRDVEFGYDDRPVLRGVSLRVCAGDRIAVLGPNGSGKSTLVKQMIGLLRPRHGTVEIQGQSVARMSVAQVAGHVGYVFQSPAHMLFAPSVAEEVAFGPRNIGQSHEEIVRHTVQALALMGLSGCEDRPPLTLSFGQQRRLCIACVIAMRSRVLLMDEPTAGQDYRSYTRFMDGISQLGVFASQVFITHDLDLAIGYANRVVLFVDGRILADGVPHEVLGQPDLLRLCRLHPTSLLEENLRLLPRTGRFYRLELLAQSL